jgi:hypothetical protein
VKEAYEISYALMPQEKSGEAKDKESIHEATRSGTIYRFTFVPLRVSSWTG